MIIIILILYINEMIFMDKINPHMVRVNLQNIIYHLKSVLLWVGAAAIAALVKV